jgi:TMEM175 potassium channel family protein
MKTNRIEAFSDGVMAIIITIMVLELKAPHDPTPASLAKMWPTLFAYVLSFIIIAIYWVNHHHLIHLVSRVDSVILWANINLLFWLSLIPWVTVYLGDNHALPFPVALYAAVSTAGAISFFFSARVHCTASSRTGVRPVDLKDGAQKSHPDSHLRCRHPRRVYLRAACLNHDRVTGGNVFSS